MKIIVLCLAFTAGCAMLHAQEPKVEYFKMYDGTFVESADVKAAFVHKDGANIPQPDDPENIVLTTHVRCPGQKISRADSVVILQFLQSSENPRQLIAFSLASKVTLIADGEQIVLPVMSSDFTNGKSHSMQQRLFGKISYENLSKVANAKTLSARFEIEQSNAKDLFKDVIGELTIRFESRKPLRDFYAMMQAKN